MKILSMGLEDPLEEGIKPTLVFLPEESYGQRSLEGYGTGGGGMHTHMS